MPADHDPWEDHPASHMIFAAMSIDQPGDGPGFCVVEIDTSITLPCGGHPATVSGLYWSMETATEIAKDLNAKRILQ